MRSEVFIEKAIAKHGNKYDYSLVVDTISVKEKYVIICPAHGEFTQRGDAHLNDQGCGKCGNSVLSNVDEFIRKANIIHGNKYDYSDVNYINSKTNVSIKCPKHQIFKQTPDSHLCNHGCPDCGFEITAEYNKNIAGENFIERAKSVHGDKYDYSLCNYVDATTKLEIICPKHKIFKQTPNDHLSSRGCPYCNSSKGEINISKILDKFNIEHIRQKKFDCCKNKRKLPFDFYLPEHNICIEFDGIQHYMPVKFRKYSDERALEMFKKVKINDNIKNNFCLQNNIKLIRISYLEKDVENILLNNIDINIIQ